MAKQAVNKNTQVKETQTLIDMCIQELGTAERIFELALLNGLSVTSILTSGQVIQFPAVNFSEQTTVDYFTNKEKKWYPAGGDPSADAVPGGIGYMQIETTFKVS